MRLSSGCFLFSSLLATDFCYDPDWNTVVALAIPDSPTELPNLAVNGADHCTPTNQCTLCEGDCDNDEDCEGDLICFQREPYDPVPGCQGSDSSSKFISLVPREDRRIAFAHIAFDFIIIFQRPTFALSHLNSL